MAGISPGTVTFNNSACFVSGPNCTFGIRYVSRACFDIVQPGTFDQPAKSKTAQCILSNITEYEKAVLASSSYLLTLWPAIVGIIGSFAPDASDLVCDSILWSCMFALTSAGLPGLGVFRPRHHVTTDDAERGREICSKQSNSSTRSRAMARHRIKRGLVGRVLRLPITMEWLLFLFSVTMYVVFSLLFILSLRNALLFAYDSPFFAGGWYWFGSSPQIMMLLSELLQDRVDLYESSFPSHGVAADSVGDSELATALQADRCASPTKAQASSKIKETSQLEAAGYYKVTAFSIRFFHKWCRILGHQWQRRSDYRLLVHPPSHQWGFRVWNVLVGIIRVAIFSIGCITMGNVFLLPQPQDVILFVLLIMSSVIPRLAWTKAGMNRPGRPDMVVWVRQNEFDDVYDATNYG